MTIANIWTDGERALVAVDTISTIPGRPDETFECDKMLTLSRSGTIICGVGILGLLRAVHHLLERTERAGGFDDEWQVLTQELPGIWLELMRERAALGPAAGDLPASIAVALVGYSRTLGRMVCRRFDREGTGWASCEFVGLAAHPELPAWGGELSDERGATVEGMVDLAREQLAWWQTADIGYPTGGELRVAELTRDAIYIATRALP